MRTVQTKALRPPWCLPWKRIKERIKRSILEPTLFCLTRNKAVGCLLSRYQLLYAILMYHRVLPESLIPDDGDPNNALVVSAVRFEEQIKYLKDYCRVIPMSQLLYEVGSPSEKPPVVITFDDGYRDNMLHAWPILKKYQVPAIIYLATRFLEGDSFLWHLDTWEIIKGRSVLEFEWKRCRYQYELGSYEKKVRCNNQINQLMRSCSSLEEQKTLCHRLNADKTEFLHASEMLSWEDLREMSRDPLVTFGAHSHNHLNLRILPEDVCREELVTSQRLLKSHLGIDAEHLAYPYGTPHEVSAREAGLARSCGFKTAVTINWPSSGTTCNPWMLPRFTILDRMTKYSLHRLLTGWDGLLRNPFKPSRAGNRLSRGFS